MGWRRSPSRSTRGRSPKTRGWKDEVEQGEDLPEGIELAFVCKDIPVLGLDKFSVFSEHASWMLQSALASSAKADSLFEYCEDKEIERECRVRLGLTGDEMGIVRVKQRDLRHVKAVGTSGKRSFMLAMVVALAMQDCLDLKALCKELRDYKVDDKEFLALIELCRKGAESPPNSEEEEEDVKDALEEEGVDLKIIGKGIPVLGMTKDSVFQECASWLIQTASGTCGKADSVFEYFSDQHILSECRRMGLTEQEVGLVRMRGKQQHVQAVGTSGKRSIMLAVVVALVLSDEMTSAQLMKEVEGYDSSLAGPVRALLRAAMGMVGRPSVELKRAKQEEEEEAAGGRGRRESRKDDDWGWGSSWGGKRKWQEDDKDWGTYDWSKWGPRRQYSREPSSKKRNRSKSSREESASEKSLDQQLVDYWDGDD